MQNKKSSCFARRDNSIEEVKESPRNRAGATSTNIVMLTNISIDNGSSSLGSGRGFKPNNFNKTQQSAGTGIKKSLGSNNTGS